MRIYNSENVNTDSAKFRIKISGTFASLNFRKETNIANQGPLLCQLNCFVLRNFNVSSGLDSDGTYTSIVLIINLRLRHISW